MAYKEDQGRLARMAAFWTITLLVLFGCNFLFEQLVGMRSMQKPLWDIRLPVVGIELSPAFLISAAIFGVGVVVVQRWQSRPQVADLLIDTEAELRKVTWPTMEEVTNSSFVVVFFVLFLGLFLAVADMVLSKLVKLIILGG